MTMSEQQLEDKLVLQLENQGFELIDLPNEQAVIDNFRNQMNLLNKDVLKGKNLTDGEFVRLNNAIDKSTVFETTKLFHDTKVNIERDDGSTVYINFYNPESEVNNHFQVAHQITVVGLNDHENRYDVTLLMNGFPLVHIELKKTGRGINEAWDQIMRYRKMSLHKLFKFEQIFIISDDADTKYFANSDRELNRKFTFNWSDKNNKHINHLDEFAESFLSTENLFNMIVNYMVLDNSEKKVIALRPYQIYAINAMVDQVNKHPDRNGYIWHTTGSGKTLTSFKAAQIISRQSDVTKVIFMLDRSDLDKQTTENFKSYAESSDLMDGTNSTKDLEKKLKGNNNLVITTIQKMAHLSRRNSEAFNDLKDQRVVIIVDEAHRSTFGDDQQNIQKSLPQSQWLGLTGTPLFEENKSQDGRTTADIFGDLLHKYSITEALRDKNVLGFNVQYNSVGQIKDEFSDEMVTKIDTAGLQADKNRIKVIVEDVLNHYDQISRQKNYNSFFTARPSSTALDYYFEFKRQIEEKNLDINVAAIMTWQANEEGNEDVDELKHTQLRMDEVVDDYNKKYDGNFSTNNFGAYARNLQTRFKKHSIDTPKQNIDILVVVDMMLTGFDAPKLNTLYIDRSMQYQKLIQAWSRTNRIEKGTKPVGEIISYYPLKEAADAALKLYGGDTISQVLQSPYVESVEKFKEAIRQMLQTTPNPDEVDELGAVDTAEFLNNVGAVNRQLIIMQGYLEFDWKNGLEKFGISKSNWDIYLSKAKTRRAELKEDKDKGVPVFDLVEFEIEEITHDKVDLDFIRNLLRTMDSEPTQQDIEAVKQAVEKKTNDPIMKSKVKLVIEFLDSLKAGSIHENVEEEFMEEVNQRRNSAIVKFAQENKLDIDVLNDVIRDYQITGVLHDTDLNNSIEGVDFRTKKALREKWTQFITVTVLEYDLERV